MEQFTTIKELETPIKLTRFLYFYDLLFIGAYTFFSYKMLVNFIYSKLQIIYLLNCIAWGIFFIVPVFGNPNRKNWQNILNTLFNLCSGKTYYEEKEIEDEDI